VNPASFLNTNDLNVFVLYNDQYAGFDGHPNTELFDFSLVFNNHKFGLTIINDVINFDKMQDIKARYSRKFLLADNNKSFSLGLGMGIFNRNLSKDQLVFERPNDPLGYQDYRKTYFDYDVGVEVQLNNFAAGFSTTHLGKVFSEVFNETYVEHFNLYGQYMFQLNGPFRILPNFIVRYWEKSYLIDAGAIVFYKSVWLGASYSGYHELTVNTGAELTKNIMFGYAFKTNMNSDVLGAFTSGTHEIFLNFSLKRDYRDVLTPRYID